MDRLFGSIVTERAIPSVIGLWYVGLPLTVPIAHEGYRVKVADISADRMNAIDESHSPKSDRPFLCRLCVCVDAPLCDLDQAGSSGAGASDLSRIYHRPAVIPWRPTALSLLWHVDVCMMSVSFQRPSGHPSRLHSWQEGLAHRGKDSSGTDSYPMLVEMSSHWGRDHREPL